MTDVYYWLVGAAAIITLILNVIVMVRGGVFNTVSREEKLTNSYTQSINNLRTETTASLDKLRSETTHNLAVINKEMNEGFETFTNRFSDTVQAVREYAHKIETSMERDFLRKMDYYEHARNISETITARLDRQDAVIDLIRTKFNV